MNSILSGEVIVTFVRGGVAKESKNLYLQVSDGIEPKFIRFSKALQEDKQNVLESLKTYERGDTISLQVEVNVVSGEVLLTSIEAQ